MGHNQQFELSHLLQDRIRVFYQKVVNSVLLIVGYKIRNLHLDGFNDNQSLANYIARFSRFLVILCSILSLVSPLTFVIFQ